jgi:hypothetical protein
MNCVIFEIENGCTDRVFLGGGLRSLHFKKMSPNPLSPIFLCQALGPRSLSENAIKGGQIIRHR